VGGLAQDTIVTLEETHLFPLRRRHGRHGVGFAEAQDKRARNMRDRQAVLHVKTIDAECGRARKLPRAASKEQLLCRIIIIRTHPYTTSSSFEMFHLRPLLRSAPRAARCISTQTARSTLRSSQVAPVRRQLQACRVAAFSTSNARFQSDGQGGTST